MIKFGPSGNSLSFVAAGIKHTEDAAVLVKNMGLDCYEYSFGRGVHMGEEKARSLGAAFAAQGIEISVHAPYYINFAGGDEGVEKSIGYVLSSAHMCKLMGGKRIVFHPASQGKMNRDEAVRITANGIAALADSIRAAGLDDLIYCPETMGKLRQIGTLEEVAEFCAVDKFFVPCIDFGHLNSREGGSLKTEADFVSRINYLIAALGFERVCGMHVHFSKIEYGAKGELRHLTFEDEKYGPDFEPFIAAVKRTGIHPYIVCESAGTQAEDALKMKEYYNKI